VFPNSNDAPARTPKGGPGSSISFAIFFDLASPPFCVRRWPGCVFGTTVPKASVNEYGNLLTGNYKIGSASSAIQRGVDSKTKPELFEAGAQPEFRISASQAHGSHTPTCYFGRRFWSDALRHGVFLPFYASSFDHSAGLADDERLLQETPSQIEDGLLVHGKETPVWLLRIGV
jgi:hypothetical protein